MKMSILRGITALKPFGDRLGLKTRFDPFEQLERINPILWREFGEAQLMLYKKGLAIYNGKFLGLVIFIYIVTFAAEIMVVIWGLVFPRAPRLSPLVIFAPPSILISIGVDVYASIRTISRWYAASRHEAWDTLRLAMRDDTEVIHTYEALGNIATWNAFRFDLEMRALPTAFGVIFGLAVMIGTVIGIIQHLVNAVSFEWIDVLTLIASGYFWTRVATLYSSDPIWRFRANTLWSLVCAMQFRDMATAITVAITGGLGVRILQFGAILAVYESWELLVGSSAIISPLIIVWLVVMGFVTRWFYRRLYTWLERRALATLAA